MKQETADRINRVREEVKLSGLESEHKDVLNGRLDHAAVCANGTPDKVAAIAAAVSDGIVHEVQQEVRMGDRIKHIVNDAIEEHERRSEAHLKKIVKETIDTSMTEHLKNCPRASAPAEAGPLLVKFGAFGAWFGRQSVEGKMTLIFVALWALDKYGVEKVGAAVKWFVGLFS